MLRRRLVVLLPAVALATAGCFGSEGRADRKVLAELRALDILALPDAGTRLDLSEVEGGGSDLVAIRNASFVTLVYATPMAPEAVTEWYHAAYDSTWRLSDNGGLHGSTSLVGQGLSDTQAYVTIEARPVRDADGAPASTTSVVTVVVSKTRD